MVEILILLLGSAALGLIPSFLPDLGALTQGGDTGEELPDEDRGDRIEGGDTADTLVGTTEDDTIQGGAGDDRIDTNGGDDRVRAGEGDDLLTDVPAHLDPDALPQGFADAPSDDTLYGDAGDDTILGQRGADRLHGGLGDDGLFAVDLAPGAADALHGGYGDDTLSADDGDILTGGEGIDSFLQFVRDSSTEDPVIVADWTPGESISLVIADPALPDAEDAFREGLVLRDTGEGAVLSHDGVDLMLVRGAAAAELGAGLQIFFEDA